MASYAGMTLRATVLKIHVYAGLLTFGQLMIYGSPVFQRRSSPGWSVRRSRTGALPAVYAGAVRDRQGSCRGRLFGCRATARAAGSRLVPAAHPRQRSVARFLQRQRDLPRHCPRAGTPDPHRADPEQRLAVRERHPCGDARRRRGATIVRAWAVYNELAMWCLLAFCASGLYLWLSARPAAPGHGRAWRPVSSPSVVCGCRFADMFRNLRAIHRLLASFSLPFLLMYAISAVQMAHGSWFVLKPDVRELPLSLSPGLTDARAIAREVTSRRSRSARGIIGRQDRRREHHAASRAPWNRPRGALRSAVRPGPGEDECRRHRWAC